MGKRLGRCVRAAVGEDPHIVFAHVGRATFGVSVFVARRGGTVVACGSSTGYRHEFDNRYRWMRLKRIIGSHGADLHEQAAVHRLLDLGRLGLALTTTYPLHETAEAARLVQRNLHLGKVGVLALAPGRAWGRGTTPGSRVRVVPHINAYGVRPLSGGRPCASSSPEPPATSAAHSPTG